MTTEPDGVAAEVEQLLQHAGRTAADLARHHAIRRTHELRDATRASEQRASDTQARFHAEREAARAQLAAVRGAQWWEHAGAREIAQAWQTAQAWREHDPDAQEAAVLMRAEMIDRLGVDPVTVDQESLGAIDRADTGHAESHDVTAAEVRSREGETSQQRPVGDRGRQLEAALLELRESRRLAGAARQAPLAEVLRDGGPRRPPRARTSRGRPGLGAERERGR